MAGNVEPEDVRKATSVEKEIKKGETDDVFEGHKRYDKTRPRWRYCGDKSKKMMIKKKSTNGECCDDKRRRAESARKKKVVVKIEKPCIPPKQKVTPRHCLTKEGHIKELSTPVERCPPEGIFVEAIRRPKPTSARIKQLAKPNRHKLRMTLEQGAYTLPPAFIDNLIKSLEGEACLTPEQAEKTFRDKKRQKDLKKSGRPRRSYKSPKIPKKIVAPSMPLFDKEAVMSQYLIAEAFVKSILDWKSSIPKEEFSDISNVVFERMKVILDHGAFEEGDRKSKQIHILADVVASWISGILLEVAETQKEELQKYCEEKQQRIKEEEEEEEEEEVMLEKVSMAESESESDEEGKKPFKGKEEAESGAEADKKSSKETTSKPPSKTPSKTPTKTSSKTPSKKSKESVKEGEEVVDEEALKKLLEEEKKKREEEEEAEKLRLEEEEKKKKEEEERLRLEEEEKKKKEEEERLRLEEEEKLKLEEEEKKKKEEEERLRLEEEEKKKKEEEERLKLEEEEKKKKEEEEAEKLRLEEEEKKKKEEEERLRLEEEEKLKLEEEEKLNLEEEEKLKLEEEEKKKKEEEEAEKLRLEEEERKRKEEEERLKREEEEKLRLEEEDRLKQQKEKEEQDRLKREEEDKKRKEKERAYESAEVVYQQSMIHRSQLASKFSDLPPKTEDALASLFKTDLPFITVARIIQCIYDLVEKAPENMGEDPITNRLHRAIFDKFYHIIETETPEAVSDNLEDVIDVVCGKIACWLKTILRESQILLMEKYPAEVESIELRDWSKWLSYVTDTAAEWSAWLRKVISEADNIRKSGLTRAEWKDWTSAVDTGALLWRRFRLQTVHRAHHNLTVLTNREVVKTGTKREIPYPQTEEEIQTTDL